MLHVFFGSDRTAVRDAAQTMLDTYRDTHTINTIDAYNYELGQLLNVAEGVSLFAEQFVYVLDTPSQHDEFQAELTDNLAILANAAHHYVVMEHSLLAPAKKQFAKVATSIEEFSATTKERFNTFALTDALVARDRRRLWLLFSEAKQVGIADEEIIGVLWWQLKAMRIAALTASADEAGMKSFPYSKAKQALRQFPFEQVESTARTLLAIYHDGHAGKRDLSVALEQFVLTV